MASKSQSEFNGASIDGAPAACLNKKTIIAKIKRILSENVTGDVYRTTNGKILEPTQNHKRLMKSIDENIITFVDGPAGTGKTMWGAYMALRGLIDKKFETIAITSPALEAGEKMGFLPGGVSEKMDPFIKQIHLSFDRWIGKNLREELQRVGILEICPLAYIRGMDIQDTFLFLDEAQNVPFDDLKTLFSRISDGSIFVFAGDTSGAQNDRKNDRKEKVEDFSPLITLFTQAVYLALGIGHSRLTSEDVLRNPILQLAISRGDHLLTADDIRSGKFLSVPLPKNGDRPKAYPNGISNGHSNGHGVAPS